MIINLLIPSSLFILQMFPELSRASALELAAVPTEMVDTRFWPYCLVGKTGHFDRVW